MVPCFNDEDDREVDESRICDKTEKLDRDLI